MFPFVVSYFLVCQLSFFSDYAIWKSIRRNNLRAGMNVSSSFLRCLGTLPVWDPLIQIVGLQFPGPLRSHEHRMFTSRSPLFHIYSPLQSQLNECVGLSDSLVFDFCPLHLANLPKPQLSLSLVCFGSRNDYRVGPCTKMPS